MGNKIPKEYKNQFSSFEEFKEFMMDKSRKQLVRAFDKTLKNNKHLKRK